MTRTATAEPRVQRTGHPWRVPSLDPAWKVRPRAKAWFVPTPPRGTAGVADAEPAANGAGDGPAPAGPTPTRTPPAELAGAFAHAVVGAHNRTVDGHNSPSAGEGREHGSRSSFLAEARRRLASEVAANRVHPVPRDSVADPAHPPSATLSTVSPSADGEELVATFARTLTEAGAVCHLVGDHIPERLVDNLVSEFEAWDIVVSAEPEARALADQFAQRGVEVSSARPERAAQAVMGITSASTGIAATGSLVLDSSQTCSRVVSALPRVHVCVLPAERIVASPSDVLRPLGSAGADLPASLVLVTGPSRSGDIEQILTVGAHGPAELHVIVLEAADEASAK